MNVCKMLQVNLWLLWLLKNLKTALGPVAQSLVNVNCWLRGIKMYRFPRYLTLVSTNHASSNPGLMATGFSINGCLHKPV